MKRRHLLLVALSLILSICMCFCLAACDSCNDETEPVQLATPVVTVDADGVARWSAIENASGYAYKISNGKEQTTSKTSVTLTDGQSIAVKAVGDGVNFTDSGYSESKTYEKPAQPVKLGTPTVTIDANGLASWQAVTNASGYMVKIGDTETEQTELTKQLTDGQTIQVKAIGNGIEYADSDYSVAKTYEQGTVTPQPEKLMAPTVEIDDSGLASWRAIEYATKYVYKINDGKETETTATSVQLSKGQKIIVKAIGDGENYLDSNFSAARAYIDSKLAASLSFADEANLTSQDSNSQIWTQNGITFTNEKADSTTDVSNNFNPVRLYKDSAIKVEYEGIVKIVFHCNTLSYATALNSSFTRTSITHSVDGKDVIVKFNVQVDSFDVETLSAQVRLDSIDVYVERIALPLEAPVVTIDADGNASWTAVEHATGYKYAINGGELISTDKTLVPLLDNNATIKVYAVGDGIDWANSAYSEEKTYVWQTVQLDPPAITINKAGVVSWEAVEHAVKYVYVITTDGADGEEQETTECKLEVALQDGQSIKIKTIGERRYLSSDFGDAETYTAPTEASQLNKALIEITIARDGTVSVTHPNASSFKYKVDGGEETALALDATFTLTSGQSVTVKAVGDGTIYTDSEYTDSVTYTAPQTLAVPDVTLAIEGTTAGKVVASWNAVPNATKYAYVVNGGDAVETQDNTVTVDLAEADTFKVMAVGDTNTATDGNFGTFYNDSDYCAAIEFVIDNEKTYTVAEIMPVVKYYGNSASTKEFTVKGIVSTNKAYSASYKNIDITLKEGEFVFEVFRAAFAQGVGSATTAADELVNWTVTATGKLLFYNSTKAQLTSGKVTAIEMSAADRVAYAKEALAIRTECTEEFSLPLTASYGVTISWSIDNEDDVVKAFIYDAATNEMVVVQQKNDVVVSLTATLTYGEGDDLATENKAFTLTILATGNEAPAEPITASVTLSEYAAANGWGSTTQNKNLPVDDNISVTASGSQNTGKYYSNGWRTYESDNGKIKVDAVAGYKIISVTFTYTVSNNGTLQYDTDKTTDSGTAVEVDASSIEFSVTHIGGTKKGQVIITKIDVIYIAV